jgi:hypothetical protein
MSEENSNAAAASGGPANPSGKDISAPAPINVEEAVAAKQGVDLRLEGQGASADEPRVIPASDGSAPVENSKPLVNIEPAKNSNDRASDPIHSEGKKVAQQFYSMNASEIFDLAFEGLSQFKSKLREAWLLADLSGVNIVDNMRLQCLYSALEEIEQMSNYKIPFSFQRRRIIRNIIASLEKDMSVDEDVRGGWSTDWEDSLARAESEIQFSQSDHHESENSNPPPSKKRAEATQIFTADTNANEHSTKDKTADFRDEFRMKFQSTILPSSSFVSAAKGSVLAELADGTKIYAAPERSDIAPQM